jgi:hypothetical protein
VIVLIASELSTPVSEVERMSPEKALRYHTAALRWIKLKKDAKHG